jgi:hypothetical protein
LVVLLLVEAGRLVASGNTRLLSLAVVLGAALLAAHATPMTLLTVLVIVSPLPLYMHGISAPLTPAVVFGVWLSLALPRNASARSATTMHGAHRYALVLGTLVCCSVLSMWHGVEGRTSADLGAVWRLVVGIAIFTACLSCIRSRADVHRAYVALVLAAVVVVMIAAVELAFPGVTVPGLLTSAGTLRVEHGTTNFRLYGPIGDYELLGEMLALAAVIAAFLAFRARGIRRIFWGLCIAAFFVGIALTSTRSSFVILIVGIAVALFALRGGRGRTLRNATVVGAVVAAVIPAISLIQRTVGGGYLFSRLESTDTANGVGGFVGPRWQLWQWFVDQLPSGLRLVVGSGPSFDYEHFQTYPHSLPLTLVITTGLLGAIAFFAFLGLLVVRCGRRWISERDPYAFVGALLIVLFALNEVKIEYLRQYNYQWFLWALFGIVAASSVARTEATE